MLVAVLHAASAGWSLPAARATRPVCEAAAPDTFAPILLRPLWVAPVQCAVHPPPWARPVRLLEDDTVFLTTTTNELHASTRMLLECLAQRHRAKLARAQTVVDYGCGSGVLGLAALALGPARLQLHGTDVAAPAVECAERNAQLNGLDGRSSFWLPWELPRRVEADVAVANMLAGPLIDVAPEIAQLVRPGGLVLLTGFRRESLGSVSAAYAPFFETDSNGALRVALERQGWLAVEARRSETTVSSVALSESAVG